MSKETHKHEKKPDKQTYLLTILTDAHATLRYEKRHVKRNLYI